LEFRKTGEHAIVVQGLGKRFRRRSDRPATLKERLVRWGRSPPDQWFWGLSDVTLRIKKGTMVGLLGHNGAGKSTLLRLIGGVGRPDSGSVTTHGRIGAILELGAGFHPDMTGRENGILAGIIAGLTRRQVVGRFDDIVAFAELEDVIDSPIRTYSSGMVLRLAFSIAVHTNIEILLIDEVLAVGDLAFQRKCIERIQVIKATGATIALVTHDTTQVTKYCDYAVWLDHGRVAAEGEPAAVADAYATQMSRVTQRRTRTDRAPVELGDGRRLVLGENRFGSLELEIRRVRLEGPDGARASEVAGTSRLTIELELYAARPIASPIINISITHEDGRVCTDTDTAAAGLELGTVSGCRRVRLIIERLGLGAGNYFVNVGAYERGWAYAYDEHLDVYALFVPSNAEVKGLLAPPQRWEVDPADSP
jgi:lipopolysaccharide transport system ATP-binding protein